MATKSKLAGAWSKSWLGVLAFSVAATAAGAAVSVDSRLPVILVSSIVWCGALALGYLWVRRSAAPSRPLGAEYLEAFEQVAGAASLLAAESESLAPVVAAGAPPDRTAAGLLGDVQQLANQSAEGLRSVALPSGGSHAAFGKIGAVSRVVEDIAFQANLLALSAGVEAARPIDSIAGFEAAADEVRSLAQRCASASRRIADLARESVSEARAGESQMEEPVPVRAARPGETAALAEP